MTWRTEIQSFKIKKSTLFFKISLRFIASISGQCKHRQMKSTRRTKWHTATRGRTATTQATSKFSSKRLTSSLKGFYCTLCHQYIKFISTGLLNYFILCRLKCKIFYLVFWSHEQLDIYSQQAVSAFESDLFNLKVNAVTDSWQLHPSHLK